jgi:acetyl-CoA C-acetyltransferase
MGKCHVAVVAMAGRPRTENRGRPMSVDAPEYGFEEVFGPTQPGMYALAAQRHMYEHGTTSAQLAEIKVAAAHHAQHNPNALLPKPVTVEEVLESPLVSDPLRRLDCCVTTDGGGAIVVVSPDVARTLQSGRGGRPAVGVLGHGETVEHTGLGRPDLTVTGAARSGPAAFAEADVTPGDIDYASIYDSFTITVLLTLEDLGFCAKGEGGRFVSDGGLLARGGKLPFNTDGGGLCNNHPGRRGGMTKIIEAVRQLRGEAHPEVQVPDCELALVHGTGGNLATRHASATLILERSSQ